MAEIRHLKEIVIVTEWWAVGDFGKGRLLLPSAVVGTKNSQGNNCERKRLQMIIKFLHSIRRGDPQETDLRAYAKVMEGLDAVKAQLAEVLPFCWERSLKKSGKQ